MCPHFPCPLLFMQITTHCWKSSLFGDTEIKIVLIKLKDRFLILILKIYFLNVREKIEIIMALFSLESSNHSCIIVSGNSIFIP